MKVLLIGFGSIGKRHCEVLSNFSKIKKIDLVTKQDIKNKMCYKSLDFVSDLNQYDYFVISSETNKHYEQLQFLEERVKDKLIFCEKPLFEAKRELKIKNNRVYIGYVLRFYPLLAKLKEILSHETVLSVNVRCGQYLPFWRPNTDYKNSYSSKKDKGGGVLLDLSHEIDYIQWMFGEFDEINSYQVKVSDLEIDSDDLTILIGKTIKGIFVSLSLDYISKITHRDIIVETLNYTYVLDFILNKMIRKGKDGKEKSFEIPNFERNFMFEKMHTDVLSKRKNVCAYKEALKVMNTIAIIQEQNNE